MVGIDLLDSQGRRIGAWTLPGERPMHEALYAQTSGVAAAALLDPAAVEGGFGVNTSGAVQAGSRLAISSCVAAIARGQPERVRVIATGRFAIEAVRQLMPDALIMDDLAMQGLAHALAEASS
jgi:pantothenate kinase type III